VSERARASLTGSSGYWTDAASSGVQALEDAIAYRAARVAGPCLDCAAAGPGSRCDDHDRDLELIVGYERAMSRANLDLDPVAKQARQPAHADGTWP